MAKHEVLAAYLARYVEVLTANPAQDRFRLTLVDGFAGGGLYRDARTGQSRLGSPLIMLEAMQIARVKASTLRKKPFRLDVAFLFIERNPQTARYLREVIDKRDFVEFRGRVRILPGRFEDHVEGIIEQVELSGRSRRAILFLDQYGYSQVPMGTLQRILSRLPNAEVILTFATDWLIDYLRNTPQWHDRLARLGIDIPKHLLAHAKDDLPPGQWRQAIQYVLHEELARNSGAAFYTPFFIHSADSHRAYWLVHLSGHVRAHDVMTELHWRKHTRFIHYGGCGLEMLGYDPRHDPKLEGQRLLPFSFDSPARDRTMAALMVDVPNRLAGTAGESFGRFFVKVANQTPATSGIMREVLQELHAQRQLEILTSDGKPRRIGSTVQSNDIIRLPKQRTFSFGQ